LEPAKYVIYNFNFFMKKVLAILLLVLNSSLIAFSQGTWTSRDTLPDSAMVQGIPGFSIGNYGYAGLGGQDGPQNLSDKLFQFDPSTNSWTRKANFPGKARVAPACFVVGDNAYLVTGSVKNGGTCVTECWQYNSTTNTWTQKANFPGSARTYAVGFAIDSLGYVGTGANELGDFCKDFYAYHPSTDTWTRIADFPGIARSCANGFGVGGNGYVCFGQDSLFSSAWLKNDMWEYDPLTNSWTQKNSLLGHAYYCASGFAICNNIYVGSGVDSALGWNHTFWKYNTLSDTWSQEASVPGITKMQGAAFAIGDTGYYGFGIDSTTTYNLNIFDKFFAGDSCSEITTGFNTPEHVSKVSIYPNPFNKECSINVPEGFDGTPLFALFSMEGIRQNIDIAGNDMDYTLKRNSLPSGVYILSISYGGTVFYKKLIITN
jgi:N-acetylneuraminic acid mutarotase